MVGCCSESDPPAEDGGVAAIGGGAAWTGLPDPPADVVAASAGFVDPPADGGGVTAAGGGAAWAGFADPPADVVAASAGFAETDPPAVVVAGSWGFTDPPAEEDAHSAAAVGNAGVGHSTTSISPSMFTLNHCAAMALALPRHVRSVGLSKCFRH